ncbi:MAG: thiolase family protein [Micrococcales bacterium]|nr:thiolase family protein [Micrococcales bacterium]
MIRGAHHGAAHRTRESSVSVSRPEVVFVDGVRTPFGKAGPKGIYTQTRADDLVIACMRELMRRNPQLPPERVGDVAIAATTQIGDQGLTIGRLAALLSGLPNSVPGYSVDRMCAGALTAVTGVAGSIAFGAIDVAIAGGVEHMGRHPMGEGVDPNPRIIAERLVDPSALVMGSTAENLHDRYPSLTKERCDAYAVASQRKFAKAVAEGHIQPDLVPVALRHDELGYGVATRDQAPRPDATLEGLAGLKTPFRPHGRVTAGNAAGLNDGATACLIASAEAADELGLPAKMRLVSFAFVGVEPEVMGEGPIPAAEKALATAGLTCKDIDLFELNEAFAVQVLAFLEHFEIPDDSPKVNPWGGAIAVGHPLASSGVRLMTQLAREFEERPEARYGMTAMCIGIGMGAALIWENLAPHATRDAREPAQDPVPDRDTDTTKDEA